MPSPSFLPVHSHCEGKKECGSSAPPTPPKASIPTVREEKGVCGGRSKGSLAFRFVCLCPAWSRPLLAAGAEEENWPCSLLLFAPLFFHPVPYKGGGWVEKGADETPSARRPVSGPLSPLLFARAVGGGRSRPSLGRGRRGSCAGVGRSAEQAPLPERGRGGLLPLPERGRRGLLPLPEQGRRWPALPA